MAPNEKLSTQSSRDREALLTGLENCCVKLKMNGAI